ncbi:MAG: L,D-transpeptidase/peptidoglycan binding protein [Actinomycetota bacterium]|nr:L,D-transpeptidase/peptidoglycan binding protein [Actinomycetota bacterium]
MRQLSIIALCLLIAVLLAGVGGVYAYDDGRDDLIAEGVRVGAVDVGGLRATEARALVRDRLLEPLQEPLLVRVGDESFPLSAREARIRANISAMVADAVRRSREGSVFSRTWRGLTGGQVRARIAPTVGYSEAAVQRLVDRVRVKMSRDAVDAKVDFAAQNLTVRESKTGRTIDAKRLRAKVRTALVSTAGERTVRAELEKVQPKVSSGRLADRYPVVLTVDRGGFRIRLFKNLKEVKSYPIALGEAGQETPSGLYNIANKAVNPAWNVPNSDWAGDLAGTVVPGGTPENPLKARWMGIYDGVGVHGTADRASIGSNASKGCIRMLIEDVKVLYDQVPVGAPIYID